jgi:hypothetical protein
MKNTIYINAKELIKKEAKTLKTQNPKDKAYIRYNLNNLANELIKQFNWYAMKEMITQKKATTYAYWLSSYTAKQQPK